jgi:hypothetical protein
LKDVPYLIGRSLELFLYCSRTIRQTTELVYRNKAGDSAKSAARVVVRCQFWTECAPGTVMMSHLEGTMTERVDADCSYGVSIYGAEEE